MAYRLKLYVLSKREIVNNDEHHGLQTMEYYEAIADRRHFSTTWSMHEVGENMFKSALTNPNGNPIAVAYDGGWGIGGQIKLGCSPMWVTIWGACDKLITQSGDGHHIFIEGFDVKGNTLHLLVGS